VFIGCSIYSPEGERLVATPIRFSGYYPSIDRLRDREEHAEGSDTNTGAPNGTTLAVRKHNPWESFPEGKSVEKDFSSFPHNFTQLPVVCWIIPNLNNDMYDGTTAQADA
jgi:hypothetical protein